MAKKRSASASARRKTGLSVRKPATKKPATKKPATNVSITNAVRQLKINMLANRINNNIPQNMYTNLTKYKTKGAKIPSALPFIPAYADPVDYRQLYRLENRPFNTREDLERFQSLFMYGSSTLSQEIRNLEYRWADVYFNPLVDFMGDRGLWAALRLYVPDTNVRSAKSVLARAPIANYHRAMFSGAHWVSRRAGATEVFDPYDNVQFYGTNQFCQTFAMMHLLQPEMLTRNNGNANLNDPWLKYYAYTKRALTFIERILEMCQSRSDLKKLPTFTEHQDTTIENLKACLRVCKAHPYMCVNIINLGDPSLRRRN